MHQKKGSTRILITLIASIAAAWGSHAMKAKADIPSFCVDCMMAAQMQGLAMYNPINSPAANNQANIIQMMNRFQQSDFGLSYAQNDQRIQAQMAANANGSPVWTGVGDLPGSFQRPWDLPPTNYDPTFKSNCTVTPIVHCDPVPELDNSLKIVWRDQAPTAAALIR